MLTHTLEVQEILSLHSLKGRSANEATLLEQAYWVNQTVPLSY